jgi:diaminohydroxyphosphoribosylaminopyrimidine deaminase/5-amino-6-(5-phosphoribosylamino)uracil reductase
MAATSADTTPDRTGTDRRFMREALDLAVRIPRRPWPNPPVGCVIVNDGEVVGRGAHLGAGAPHAERVALAEAGDRARGATLYCTLEPCDHHGRTPPCTDAILAAGVARVVAGVRDPNPPAGGGAQRLRTAGVAVTMGTLGESCLDLLWPFVCSDAFARPYVELKTALSLDARFGGVDDPAGRPCYLTSAPARRDVHRRRRWVDLVLVGHGTARHDAPRLDARLATDPADGPASDPAAGCVVSSVATDTRLDRERWLVFHPEGKNRHLAAGAEGVGCATTADGRVAPEAIVAACHARGLHTIMVEGGPRLAAAFLAAGLVDRWVQYHAPLALGDGPTWPASVPCEVPMHLTEAEPVGPDLRVIWDRLDVAAYRRRLAAPLEAI